MTIELVLNASVSLATLDLAPSFATTPRKGRIGTALQCRG
jgi:hypothetical protein